MRAFSAAALLGVWERGQGHAPFQQALALLAAAYPETSPDLLMELSIGQRDSRLLTLREWIFGTQLNSLAICSGCGERLELMFDIADIRAAPEAEPSEAFSLSVGDYAVRFRLPNSLDLAAITGGEEIAARRLLLERCLLAVDRGGEERHADQLPQLVVDAVVERMAQAEAQADIQLDLVCPACGHQWQATFDIVSFLWTEINVWAGQLLRDVHTLASAYGWHEAEIVAMSPWRRQCYLEIVGR
jgi:hypothetical protein